MIEIYHNDIFYRLDTNNLVATILTWKLNGYDFPKTITHEEKEYKIVKIEGSSSSSYKENYKKIKSISFPKDSLISIFNDYSFYEADSLEKIVFPSSLKEIKNQAFCDCKSLQSIEFPENSILQVIGYGAFKRTKIQKLSLPPTLKEIGNYAFYECYSLQFLEIHDNSMLQTIGEYAFQNTHIETLTIPSHIKNIGNCSFRYCYYLKTIEFKNNSKFCSIGKEIFDSTSICKIIIPDHFNNITIQNFFIMLLNLFHLKFHH